MPVHLKAIAIATLLAATFGGGYQVASWRLTARANAEALDRARQSEKIIAARTAERDAMAADLAAANDKHLNALRRANDETNRLRDRLRDGAIGLRLAGTCPALPNADGTASTRVDSGTGAELDSNARRAYFALRDGIDRAAAQLAACQDELRVRTP